MAGSLEAGLSLSEFWQATPRETFAAIKAYRRRRGWMAWHLAVLPRIEGDKLPSLETLCGDELPDRKPMDPETMLKNLRAAKSALERKS